MAGNSNCRQAGIIVDAGQARLKTAVVDGFCPASHLTCFDLAEQAAWPIIAMKAEKAFGSGTPELEERRT